MFLPPGLTASEQALVASVTRQLLAHRRPAGAEQEQVVRHEAAQIAAEMIFEARAANLTQARVANQGRSSQEEEKPDTGYHRRLLTMADRDRQIRQRQKAEREQAEVESAEDD